MEVVVANILFIMFYQTIHRYLLQPKDGLIDSYLMAAAG